MAEGLEFHTLPVKKLLGIESLGAGPAAQRQTSHLLAPVSQRSRACKGAILGTEKGEHPMSAQLHGMAGDPQASPALLPPAQTMGSGD